MDGRFPPLTTGVPERRYVGSMSTDVNGLLSMEGNESKPLRNSSLRNLQQHQSAGKCSINVESAEVSRIPLQVTYYAVRQLSVPTLHRRHFLSLLASSALSLSLQSALQ